MWLDRQNLLIGEDSSKKLQQANVLICGLGGVGGYVAEMLVRAGVENLTLIDFDVVTESNLNRQIVALTNTIGKYKVDVFKERAVLINPNCKIKVVKDKICENNLKYLINEKYNYIIDCIDSFMDKVSLIEFAVQNQYNIVSAMGAGRKFDIPSFYVTDIFKTEYDPLAKKLRKALREKSIKKLNVVTSKSIASNCNGVIGSISYYPAACGCVVASFVVNEIIKE